LGISSSQPITTRIQGPLVAEWYKDISKWIDGLTSQDDIPAIWEHFLNKFATQFQDLQHVQRAMIKLKQEIKKPWDSSLKGCLGA